MGTPHWASQILCRGCLNGDEYRRNILCRGCLMRTSQILYRGCLNGDEYRRNILCRGCLMRTSQILYRGCLTRIIAYLTLYTIYAMQNYKFIEKIGRGTHGTVYLLKSIHENKYVVCKSIINKYKTHAYREIAILSKLNHRRIPKLIENVILKDSIFLLLEHINYGSLESLISYFTKHSEVSKSSLCCINIAWSVTSQIGDALYYLHSKRIIHRDIKPSNILANRFYVRNKEFLEFKLCDFSLSTKTDGFVEDRHTVGTPFYMAPEVVSLSKYDYTVDCWGLGCCVYELLILKKPFQGTNRSELFENILKREITERIAEDENLDSLIRQCLKKSDRITAKLITRNEKVRMNLTLLELKYKESRIEELEQKLKEIENSKTVIK